MIARPARQHHVRGIADQVSGTRIHFTWPCGHGRWKDFSKGPLPKRIGEAGCKLMADWWSGAKGGVNLPPCSTCKRKGN